MSAAAEAGIPPHPAWAKLLLGASLPLAVLCLLAPTARWWFIGEMACNAGLHAAVLLLPAVIAWRRSPTVCGALLVLVLLGASPWLRAAWEDRAPRVAPAATAIPVACANLYLYNEPAERPAAVASILAGKPAIAVLAESITSSDRSQIPLLDYPYQIWQPQLRRKWRDCVVLLSKYPIVREVMHDLDTQPFIEATLDVDGKPLHVIAVHTMSPVTPDKRDERDRQLSDIADLIASLDGPVLLMGDCNLSVASPAWRDLRARSGLRRAAQREPASWPSAFGGFGITIDHVLGRGLALGAQEAFTIPGSDHRGMRGTIVLP